MIHTPLSPLTHIHLNPCWQRQTLGTNRTLFTYLICRSTTCARASQHHSQSHRLCWAITNPSVLDPCNLALPGYTITHVDLALRRITTHRPPTISSLYSRFYPHFFFLSAIRTQSGVNVLPDSIATMWIRSSAISIRVELLPSCTSEVMCAKPPDRSKPGLSRLNVGVRVPLMKVHSHCLILENSTWDKLQPSGPGLVSLASLERVFMHSLSNTLPQLQSLAFS